jgi:glycosyltransferase involved in cell wall biosynthesis
MKKIVYVVGGLLMPNGMSSILCQKINYLAEYTDYEVYMILTEKAGTPWYYSIHPRVKWINFNINFDELDTMPIYKKVIHYRIKQFKYKRLFTDYLMKIRPDITVSACRREINFINSIHDGSKKVGELHFSYDFYRQFRKPFLPNSVNRFIRKVWMNQALEKFRQFDRLVILTKEDEANWPNNCNKVVIPNFIVSLPTRVSDCRSKTVIAVGRYSPEKCYDLLIRAWSTVAQKHPDWILNIFGAGERGPYLDLIAKLQLQNKVICHPATANIGYEYQQSSIFVLSSRNEGFPLVLIESLSYGVPAVCFACPCGPKDVISNGIDGILVENGNVLGLAESICRLIERDDLRSQYGESARKNVTRFLQENVMKQWIELFESL